MALPARKRLTAKQETAARALAKSRSIAEAARTLGVTRQTAHETLTRPNVIARADALRDRADMRQAEKARLILNRAQDTVLTALPEDASGDAMFAAGVMRPALDVLERLPQEAAPLAGESPRDRLLRYRSHLHACIVGARHSQRLSYFEELLAVCDDALRR